MTSKFRWLMNEDENRGGSSDRRIGNTRQTSARFTRGLGVVLAAFALLVLPAASCHNDGPIEEGVEEVGDEIDDAM